MQHLPDVDAAQGKVQRGGAIPGSRPLRQPSLLLPQYRGTLPAEPFTHPPKRISTAKRHAPHRLSSTACGHAGVGDEAFRIALKHHRPVTLKDALRQSVRMQPANEQPKATVHRLRRD
jgi:hypothetical protein